MTNEISVSNIDTPAVLLDVDKLELNIKEMSAICAEAQVHLRPHIKVHQCAEIAKLQIKAGACGIEVGNIDQAMIMANEGINNILIAHPFFGTKKTEKLQKILETQKVKLIIVIDMLEQADEISAVGQKLGVKIPILMKIDTGIDRYGVLPGLPVLNMAEKLKRLKNINLIGVYAHETGAKPTQKGVFKKAKIVGKVIIETAEMLQKEGFKIDVVSVGASPTYRATCKLIKKGILEGITEVHPGNCIIGDIGYMKSLGNTLDQCAVSILTTVVSTSHPNHVVVDAGYKTFGADSIIVRRHEDGFFWKGMPSYGSVIGRSDLWFGRLTAESGSLYYLDPDSNLNRKLKIGDRLEIIPNNVTEVLNIHKEVYGIRDGSIMKIFKINGRGYGS